MSHQSHEVQPFQNIVRLTVCGPGAWVSLRVCYLNRNVGRGKRGDRRHTSQGRWILRASVLYRHDATDDTCVSLRLRYVVAPIGDL
eukprot:7129854-Prymnesium_polylepis.1